MYRKFIVLGALVLLTHLANGAVRSCPVTSGGITLNVKMPRSTCVSPCLLFFDATGSTDSVPVGAINGLYNEDLWTWNYGDLGISGQGTWKYGSGSVYSSKNLSAGAVGAHLYVVTPGGGDKTFQAIVSMTNGTSTATCSVKVKAYDPSGGNGFPGSETTCEAATTLPVAGSGGCPAGANVIRQANIGTAYNGGYGGSDKRILLHCGDTFNGSFSVAAGTSRMTYGAYGGCENASTNRPVITNRGGATISLAFAPAPSDIRIQDLDCEGNSPSTEGVCVTTSSNGSGTTNTSDEWLTQTTLYNLNSQGMFQSYYTQDGSQFGIIQSVMTGMGPNTEGTFINNAGNWCIANAGKQASTCTAWVDTNYNAFIGNLFKGSGDNKSNTWESFRIGSCVYCIYSNNTFENSGSRAGSALKMSGGNAGPLCYGNSGTLAYPFCGKYVQYVTVSDNVFTSNSGGYEFELAPQNNTFDERLQNYVVERNLFLGTATGATFMYVSAQNVTIRDNVFNNQLASSGGDGVVLQTRGGTSCVGCSEWPTKNIEVYNNTCYDGLCIYIPAAGGTNNGAGASGSYIVNNMCYAGTCIKNSGAGNTISNNTANVSSNPSWRNVSGAYTSISDFKPAANASGATTVPVLIDALGIPWGATPSLGAVRP